jgi:hypothetical protein
METCKISKMLNFLKRIPTCLFVLIVFNYAHSQYNVCSIEPKFENISKKQLKNAYILNKLDLFDEYNKVLSNFNNSRSLIIEFYFSEESNSKQKEIISKNLTEFRKLLLDSLKSSRTDIDVTFMFRKMELQAFIGNSLKNENDPIYHFNALIYSKDKLLLEEIFGLGSKSRIDTTSLKNKKTFNFKFELISDAKNSNDGYLYLFCKKDKVSACNPNEDLDILKIFSKIFNKNYTKACEKKSEEEEIIRKESLLTSLQKSNDSLVKVLDRYKMKINKFPRWTLFSNFDFLVGGTSSFSNFTNENIRFRGQGISSSSGFCFFDNGSDKSSIFFTSSINIGSSSFDLKRKIHYEFTQTQSEYNSISLIQNYNEEIKSSFVNIPFGIGYQLRETNWPIYFQFSANGIIGFNKLISNNGNGIASYRRLYNEPGIVVSGQPQLGLEDNVLLTGKPEYNNNISLTYGAKIDMKILYNFNNSPLSGFIDFGFNYSKTNTSSNGSVFISEFKNDQNSILNSMKNLGSLPIFVGLGISYDLRNKINIE